MAVLHDYKCEKHGYFESMADEPRCPMKNCEEEVLRVFLQAPGLMSDSTKKNDKNLKQLAIDFDMTNIKSAREGESQAGFYKRKNKMSDKQRADEQAAVDHQNQQKQQQSGRPGDSAIWGGGFKGLNMQSILSGRAVQSIAGESVGINPANAGNLTGPKAASYIPDHDNLQIKK